MKHRKRGVWFPNWKKVMTPTREAMSIYLCIFHEVQYFV